MNTKELSRMDYLIRDTRRMLVQAQEIRMSPYVKLAKEHLDEVVQMFDDCYEKRRD